ncbi:MAG: hypothetical protein EA355_02670 [Rhodobacteraceae bacterium]|nr:MAG: hypothetical protein EA355_02670 [Paracoccaceae bacterium]
MDARMFRAFALATSLALAGGAPALAQEPVTAQVLKVYAAFAKFESNISEVAALAKLRLAVESDEEQAELIEEFENDLRQVARYIGILRGMELLPTQTAVLDEFEVKWDALVADGRAIVTAETVDDDLRARVRQFWEDLDEIDDLIDDKLEEMRERHGADW